MARKIYLAFVLILALLTTSCLSILIPQDPPNYSDYLERKADLENRFAQNQQMARSIYESAPSTDSFIRAIEQCQVDTSDLYFHNKCYSFVFLSRVDKTLCQSIGKYQMAQYECYRVLLKNLKIENSEINSFCPDHMCFASYLSLDPKNQKFQHPQISDVKLRYLSIYDRATYSSEIAGLQNDQRQTGLYFHELLYAGLRTNGSLTRASSMLGYDLNLVLQGFPFGIGFGLYDLRNDIKSVDLVLSTAPKKDASVRIAAGVLIKDGTANSYHVTYGIGFLGITPLIELSSDFKKEHQLNLGITYMFQIPRRSR
ncbi:MAG: hypothetical protein JNL11_08915 [Bdellovibrionaceae bacterium]|nr:hypothetical protein [Pseudobdellovibrionaceae bacterium]